MASPPGVDDPAELVAEDGGPQCRLAGLLVHVQRAALVAGGGRGVEAVDGAA
ncbi:hypothetical protein ACFW1M_34300 [Streptomyces inhibens]|uniref:hypothetical protein n=1 Tax=Streptomyces inhibens TaxID=2293571 RepID=UPI0036CA6A58